MTVPGSEAFDWAVRAVASKPGEVKVHARNHTLTAGVQASLRPADAAPSALEHLLAALAADVVQGLMVAMRRRGLPFESVETSLSGRLENALVHLGVVGEAGHAGLGGVSGKVYVTSDADEGPIREAWDEARARAPVLATLARCEGVSIEMELRVVL